MIKQNLRLTVLFLMVFAGTFALLQYQAPTVYGGCTGNNLQGCSATLLGLNVSQVVIIVSITQ